MKVRTNCEFTDFTTRGERKRENRKTMSHKNLNYERERERGREGGREGEGEREYSSNNYATGKLVLIITHTCHVLHI